MGKVKKSVVIKNCNYEAQRYCFKKGFIIYPFPSGDGFKIRYQLGHKINYYQKGEVFTRDKVFQEVWNLYDKIYQYDKIKR